MADEDIKIDAGQSDGAVDDGQASDGDTGEQKQSDADFMAETVNAIKDTQKAILGEDDSDVGGDDTNNDSDTLKELAGTDIPDAFSDAAEAAGMAKEDIIAMADKHTDEELIEMIPHLEAALKDEEKVHENVDKNAEKVHENVDKDIDPKLIESITEKISSQLEEKIGTTLEEINKLKAYQEEQSAQQSVETASKIFDEASKDFPIFGKTDELPRFPSGRLAGQLIPTSPAMKARLEVLRYADAFMGKGANIDDAMANALATYKGLHLEKESKRNAIRDLKNHETKLSGARVGKETKKKYADSRDEIIDEIRQMKRAAGYD